MNPLVLVLAGLFGFAVLSRPSQKKTGSSVVSVDTGKQPQGFTQSKPSQAGMNQGNAISNFKLAAQAIASTADIVSSFKSDKPSSFKVNKPGATGIGKNIKKSDPLFEKAQSCKAGTSWSTQQGACIADEAKSLWDL